MAATSIRDDSQTNISDQELFDKYGRLCGYIAQRFIHRIDSNGERHNDLQGQDAEEFASAARISLLKMPQKYRTNPYVIQRSITNAIIDAWRKRIKQTRNEWQPPQIARENSGPEDYFDSLPGRDGLAEHTQVALDIGKALAILPLLSCSERTVIELHFGLNDCQPCTSDRIAKKLGRSERWVSMRLEVGLKHLRERIVGKPVTSQV
jgi:RNA polymerase sigma factor (sigma-70 family)